jgi:plasmid stabilization system protein ParE
MRFHASKKAERELDEIFVYWARRAGFDVADRLVDSIEERFALSGDYPFVGRKCDEIAPGVFSFLAGKYLIYYRKKRGIIRILHVFHGTQDQGRAFTQERPR